MMKIFGIKVKKLKKRPKTPTEIVAKEIRRQVKKADKKWKKFDKILNDD